MNWPVGVGMDRNSGVAWHVHETDGAIGYVDLLHVMNGELAYGAVENKDEPPAFIRASADSMTAAAKELAAQVPDDLTFSLTNRPGKGAYPICGGIWAVCFQSQPAGQHKQVLDFLRWVMQDGQTLASNLSYAPLPKDLVQRAEQRLNAIKAAP
jgi:phosphate transport system substrate-binding protein